jgi:hypothetical protein
MILDILYPLAGTYLYANFPRKLIENIPESVIANFSAIHNLFLSSFSFFTFIFLISNLVNYGIVVDRGYYFAKPQVDTVLYCFYMSKYYEYIDTWILYAKKRKPIFLQKYHHMGAVIVWYLGYVCKFDGVFFASLLNSGVHAIMYFYYFLTVMNSKSPIRNAKVYITTMQIGQLAYGAFALPWYYYEVETFKNRVVICIFDIYIGGLIYLFCEFMIKNYVYKKRSVKNA